MSTPPVDLNEVIGDMNLIKLNAIFADVMKRKEDKVDPVRSLLVQAYRMKQEHPHMSPVGIEMEMYSALMAEVKEITTRIQMSAEA